MEMEVLKAFVNHSVEVLVGGVWLEGRLAAIVKGVVTLMPLKEAAAFYGPASVKAENILAIRQIKMQEAVISQPETQAPSSMIGVMDPNIRSSLEQVPPNERFKRK